MDRRQFIAAGAAAAVPLFVGHTSAGHASAGPEAVARPLAGRTPRPTAYAVTRWDADPWSRGSYSALPSGVSPSVRRVIADAIIGERIVLAGEYASTQYPATVNGAYLSGRYAAGRLLARQGPRTAVVIGAGIAGAAAARELQDAGVEVTVLEARRRIGGRIHSDDQWGAPVELGAAWIHGTRGNPLVPLARSSGLGLVATDYNDAVARDTVTGRVSARAEGRWDRLDTLMGRLEEAWPPRELSVQKWLQRKGWRSDRFDAWAAQVEITQEYALDPSALGVRALEEGSTYRGGDALVTGGYASIVAELLRGVETRLAAPVSRISYRTSGVEVRIESGERVVADIAVVAVPLALIRAGLPQIPDLPGDVRRGLGQLATGVFEKVVLRYDDQWWGDHRVYGVVGGGAPGAPRGSAAALRWTEFYSLTDVVGIPVLVGFAGGSSARSRPKSDAACAKEATRALNAAFART